MPQHGRTVTANIDRLNAYMDKNGLAAVAVRTGVNFTYLSGMTMPGTLSRHLDIASTVRGFMVLWPRQGDPVVILDAFAEKLARRSPGSIGSRSTRCVYRKPYPGLLSEESAKLAR